MPKPRLSYYFDLVSLGRKIRCSPSRVFHFVGPAAASIIQGVGKPYVFHVGVNYTSRCRKNCWDCYTRNIPGDTLSCDDFRKVIREARSVGARTIFVLGGEPFLPEVRSNLLRIIKEHPWTYFTVCTDPQTLDAAFLRELRKLKNLFVLLSVEGFRAKTDARRGVGTFDAALNAARFFKRNRMPFAFAVQVSKSNLEEATSDEFLSFVRKCNASLYYSPLSSKSLGNELSESERADLAESIPALSRKFNLLILSHGFFVSRHLKPVERYSLTVNPDMSVCDSRIPGKNSLIFGNLRETSLKQLLRTRPPNYAVPLRRSR